MSTLFISDLHLDPQRPAVTRLFLDFLEQRAVNAEALYILGDLFEVWVGDDDKTELNQQVTGALQALSQRGIPVYLLHGNRDFLLAKGFASASGTRLLPETMVIDLYGTPTLIMHGDVLCTDDINYQRFRAWVRSPFWQNVLLRLPLALRRRLARKIRNYSQKVVREKADFITDVNPKAVANAMRSYQVRRLIHGHTHRPDIHKWLLDGESVQRIVLGDWYQQGSVLCCDARGCRLETLLLG